MKTAKSSSTGPPPHKRHRIKSSMLNKELPPLPPNPLISKLSATDLLQNRFREHLHDRSSQKSSELRYYHPTFQQQKKRELNQSQLYGKKYTPEAVALWNEQVLSHLVRGDASPAVYPIPDSPSSSLRVPNFTNNDICTSPALRSVMTASITTVSPNSLKSSSPCVSPVIPPPSPSPPQTFPTDTQPSPLPLYQLAATATTATTSAPGIVAQLAPPNLSDSSSSAQLRLLSTIQNQSKQTIQQPVASSPTSSSYSSSPSSSSSSVSSSTPSQSSQRQRSNSDAPVEAESSSVNQPQLAPDLFSQELEQQQKLKNDLKQKGVDSQVIDIKHKSIEADSINAATKSPATKPLNHRHTISLSSPFHQNTDLSSSSSSSTFSSFYNPHYPTHSPGTGNDININDVNISTGKSSSPSNSKNECVVLAPGTITHGENASDSTLTLQNSVKPEKKGLSKTVSFRKHKSSKSSQNYHYPPLFSNYEPTRPAPAPPAFSASSSGKRKRERISTLSISAPIAILSAPKTANISIDLRPEGSNDNLIPIIKEEDQIETDSPGNSHPTPVEHTSLLTSQLKSQTKRSPQSESVESFTLPLPIDPQKIGKQSEKQKQLVLRAQQLEQQALLQNNYQTIPGTVEHQDLNPPVPPFSSTSQSRRPSLSIAIGLPIPIPNSQAEKTPIKQIMFDQSAVNTPPGFASIPYSATFTNPVSPPKSNKLKSSHYPTFSANSINGAQSLRHIRGKQSKEAKLDPKSARRPSDPILSLSTSPSSPENPGFPTHPIRPISNALAHLSLSVSAASFFNSSSSEDEDSQNLGRGPEEYYHSRSLSGLKTFKGQRRRDRSSRLPLSSIPKKTEEHIEDLEHKYLKQEDQVIDDEEDKEEKDIGSDEDKQLVNHQPRHHRQKNDSKSHKHKYHQSSIMFVDGIIPKEKKRNSVTTSSDTSRPESMAVLYKVDSKESHNNFEDDSVLKITSPQSFYDEPGHPPLMVFDLQSDTEERHVSKLRSYKSTESLCDNRRHSTFKSRLSASASLDAGLSLRLSTNLGPDHDFNQEYDTEKSNPDHVTNTNSLSSKRLLSRGRFNHHTRNYTISCVSPISPLFEDFEYSKNAQNDSNKKNLLVPVSKSRHTSSPLESTAPHLPSSPPKYLSSTTPSQQQHRQNRRLARSSSPNSLVLQTNSKRLSLLTRPNSKLYDKRNSIIPPQGSFKNAQATHTVGTSELACDNKMRSLTTPATNASNTVTIHTVGNKSTTPGVVHVPSPIRAVPHPTTILSSNNNVNNFDKRFSFNSFNSFNSLNSSTNTNDFFSVCGGQSSVLNVGVNYPENPADINDARVTTSTGGCINANVNNDGTNNVKNSVIPKAVESGPGGRQNDMIEENASQQKASLFGTPNNLLLGPQTFPTINNNTLQQQNYQYRYPGITLSQSLSPFPQSLSPPPPYPLPNPHTHSNSYPNTSNLLNNSTLANSLPQTLSYRSQLGGAIAASNSINMIATVGSTTATGGDLLSPAATSTPINIPKPKSPNYFNKSLVHMSLPNNRTQQNHRHTISVDTDSCEMTMNSLIGSMQREHDILKRQSVGVTKKEKERENELREKEEQKQTKRRQQLKEVQSPSNAIKEETSKGKPVYKRLETTPVVASADGMSYSSSIPNGSLSVTVTVLEPIVPSEDKKSATSKTESSKRKLFSRRFSGLHGLSAHLHNSHNQESNKSKSINNSNDIDSVHNNNASGHRHKVPKDDELSPVKECIGGSLDQELDEELKYKLGHERNSDSPVGGSSSDNNNKMGSSSTTTTASESESPKSFEDGFDKQEQNRGDLGPELLMPPPSLELVSSALRPIPSDTHVPEIPTINAARLSHVGSNLDACGRNDGDDYGAGNFNKGEMNRYHNDEADEEDLMSNESLSRQNNSHKVTNSDSSSRSAQGIAIRQQYLHRHARSVSNNDMESENYDKENEVNAPPIPPRSVTRVLHQERIRSIISQNSARGHTASNSNSSASCGESIRNNSRNGYINNSFGTDDCGNENNTNVPPLHIVKKTGDSPTDSLPEPESPRADSDEKQVDSARASVSSFDDVLKTFINEDLKFLDDDDSLDNLGLSAPNTPGSLSFGNEINNSINSPSSPLSTRRPITIATPNSVARSSIPSLDPSLSAREYQTRSFSVISNRSTKDDVLVGTSVRSHASLIPTTPNSTQSCNSFINPGDTSINSIGSYNSNKELSSPTKILSRSLAGMLPKRPVPSSPRGSYSANRHSTLSESDGNTSKTSSLIFDNQQLTASVVSFTSHQQFLATPKSVVISRGPTNNTPKNISTPPPIPASIDNIDSALSDNGQDDHYQSFADDDASNDTDSVYSSNYDSDHFNESVSVAGSTVRHSLPSASAYTSSWYSGMANDSAAASYADTQFQLATKSLLPISESAATLETALKSQGLGEYTHGDTHSSNSFNNDDGNALETSKSGSTDSAMTALTSGAASMVTAQEDSIEEADNANISSHAFGNNGYRLEKHDDDMHIDGPELVNKYEYQYSKSFHREVSVSTPCISSSNNMESWQSEDPNRRDLFEARNAEKSLVSSTMLLDDTDVYTDKQDRNSNSNSTKTNSTGYIRTTVTTTPSSTRTTPKTVLSSPGMTPKSPMSPFQSFLFAGNHGANAYDSDGAQFSPKKRLSVTSRLKMFGRKK